MSPGRGDRVLLLSMVLLAVLCLSVEARRGRKRAGLFNEKERSAAVADAKKGNREGKLFSLFNIVTFDNAACSSTSTLGSSRNRNGTCLTSTECNDKSGTASGNCAAGFGVCCVFILDASDTLTVNQNCTYIQNPGFPSAYSATSNLAYTVNKCDNNVCELRLDFESFTLRGTGLTTEATGGACTDTFTVNAGNTNQNIPVICGQNTGQHMYVDIGNQDSDTATLNFAFTGTATNRMWDVKVTQIPCGSRTRPPNGCLQYHTGLTGRITSFNFIPETGDNHLANQDYSSCVRQEEGYCCIQWSVCSDTNSFTIFDDTAITGSLLDRAGCTEDYVVLPAGGLTCAQGGANNVVHNRFCGMNFNPVTGQTQNIPICDCTQPFQIGIVTDATADTATAANLVANRGVCFEYRQIPCN